ncbi:hypothetical protein SAMN04487931_10462 [Desulfobacula phenolica]|uniref:Uncharacterized protein n=1 Tax=Desulfobacula phenolica TaxID=90732 RepID=A0A1H2FB88_9BACT|nr:hypothetical protein SAMN04487931_10462 [Desulfobacula phenolica]
MNSKFKISVLCEDQVVMEFNGMDLSREEMEASFDLELSKGPPAVDPARLFSGPDSKGLIPDYRRRKDERLPPSQFNPDPGEYDRAGYCFNFQIDPSRIQAMGRKNRGVHMLQCTVRVP